jgi:hypothetical protein
MRLYWPRFGRNVCADLICPLLKEQSAVDIRTLGVIERVRLVLQIMQTEISCLRAVAGYRTRGRNRKVDIRRGNKNNWCQLVIT